MCHLIPIGLVPPDPDRSAVSWTEKPPTLRERAASPPRRPHRVGPPATCLPDTLALGSPVSTPGPDHLPEADQCGGDGGGVGPEFRGGRALVESAGARGGGPGW